MPPENSIDYRRVAAEFAQALCDRDYPTAYALTSQSYQRTNTLEQLQGGFETIVPPDWGTIGPIEVGETLADWPGKEPADLGWAYVSIGGEVYSEAVTVIIASVNGAPKIREIAFGRP